MQFKGLSTCLVFCNQRYVSRNLFSNFFIQEVVRNHIMLCSSGSYSNQRVWILCSIIDLVLSHCSEGGYFNAIMTFPDNYPNSPPSVRFTSEMWHPNGQTIIFFFVLVGFIILLHAFYYLAACLNNALSILQISVYPDGRVCISILHAPGDDPNGYELASERWTPVHTVNFFSVEDFIFQKFAF